MDTEFINFRLEEAGRTLLSLPADVVHGRLNGRFSSISASLDAYGWGNVSDKPEDIRAPNAAHITRMDEALGWIQLIPVDRYVLRRIVGARSLVSPVTERHLFPWRRLGLLLGCDHKAVQRWHAQGIDLIAGKLNTKGIAS